MCEWGTLTELLVPLPTKSGEIEWKLKGVDSCIASIVQALNDSGLYTLSSCCGHGTADGSIGLHDGRLITLSHFDVPGSRCNQDDNDPHKVVSMLIDMERHEMDRLSDLVKQTGVSPAEVVRVWMEAHALDPKSAMDIVIPPYEE
jgi:hypothetical protein